MKSNEILTALRSNVEGISEVAGVSWGVVYLDSARPAGCGKHAFAGFLSALEASGDYRRLDGDFGEVKMA